MLIQKKTIIIFLMGAIVGSLPYFFVPKNETIIEKESQKTDIVSDTSVAKDTVTKIVETQKPDGTKITETLIENKDQIQNHTQVQHEQHKERIHTIEKDPKNRLSLKALMPLEFARPQPYYELSYQRQIIGPIRGEISVDTRGEKRVGIVAEFNF